MGIREVQAYRAREFMTAREFIGFWLEEEPGADPYEVVALLADLVKAERTCIHRRDFNRVHDFWAEKQGAIRNELRKSALATFKSILDNQNGIDETESVPLARDALVKAFEKIEIAGPRFLYPPTSPTDSPGSSAPPSQPASVAPAVHPRAKELSSGLCSHSADSRIVVWYGEKFIFSDQQALVIKALWREWEKGDLGLAQGTLGELVRSSSNRFQLRNTFRVSGKNGEMHSAWGRMVHPAGKGLFKLGPPPS